LAARGGHREIVAFLLDRGSPINQAAYNSFTPLHLTSNGEVARMLLKAGADPNAVAVQGTVIERAAIDGKTQVVEALFETGQKIDLGAAISLGMTGRAKEMLQAEPALANSAGWPTPLMRAVRRNDEELVTVLLDAGADVNAGSDIMNAAGRWTALSSAVTSGSECVAVLLLTRSADPNACGGKNEESLLHFSVINRSTELVRLMLEKGADPNSEPEWPPTQRTPLQLAALQGKRDVCDVLLSAGADVNRGPVTPLLLAAAAGGPEIAELLLERGAALDIWSACALGREGDVRRLLTEQAVLLEARDRYRGRTPLSWAVHGGDAALASMLLEHGAQVSARSIATGYTDECEYYGPIDVNKQPSATLGETPLHIAVRSGRGDVVSLLLDHGAEINAHEAGYQDVAGMTPLHAAASRGDVELVKLLLDRGAAIDSEDSEGTTPLHLALVHHDVVELLVTRGAKVTGANRQGRSVVDCCWQCTPQTVQLLADRGAPISIMQAIKFGQQDRARKLIDDVPAQINVESPDHPGDTPLLAAAEAGDVELVRLLLDRGADINHVTKWGRSALVAAAERGHVTTVRLLLTRGATIRFDSYYGDALCASARSGKADVAMVLLEHGADPHRRSLGQVTALHAAANANNPEMIALLLDAGLDTDLDGRLDSGSRPLHAAAYAGAREAVELLLSRGADPAALDYHGRTPRDCAKLAAETRGWCSDAAQQERCHEVAMLLLRRMERNP
jgi:ankyrin repeat protein